MVIINLGLVAIVWESELGHDCVDNGMLHTRHINIIYIKADLSVKGTHKIKFNVFLPTQISMFELHLAHCIAD